MGPQLPVICTAWMGSVGSRIFCLQCEGGVGNDVLVGSGGGVVGGISVKAGCGVVIISATDVDEAGEAVQPAVRTKITESKISFFMMSSSNYEIILRIYRS